MISPQEVEEINPDIEFEAYPMVYTCKINKPYKWYACPKNLTEENLKELLDYSKSFDSSTPPVFAKKFGDAYVIAMRYNDRSKTLSGKLINHLLGISIDKEDLVDKYREKSVIEYIGRIVDINHPFNKILTREILKHYIKYSYMPDIANYKVTFQLEEKHKKIKKGNEKYEALLKKLNSWKKETPPDFYPVINEDIPDIEIGITKKSSINKLIRQIHKMYDETPLFLFK